MKKYKLDNLVRYGSHARKKISSDVIIGDPANGYDQGDILDANATMDQVNSKMEDVLGVNAENINNLVEILNDNDAATGILSQLNAKQDAITSDNKLSADLVADGTTNKAFTAAEKTKLSDIATGAEVNVQSDWNQTNTSADDYIKNKPTNVSAFTNDAEYVTEDDMQIDIVDANGHDYIEIGGVKWATMNVGATSITGIGLYFAWGDTQGYTAEQVGSGEEQKYFGWVDYKYGNGTSLPDATGMTKYNATDGKTVPEAVDDAAVANWGGGWRMPTAAEFQALCAAVNTVWTDDYQGSGVAGLVCTDKTDSSKVLFFPASGICNEGSVDYVDYVGYYWSSSLYSNDVKRSFCLYFDDEDEKASCDSNVERYYGFFVRGVLSTSKNPKYATKAELDTKQDAIDSSHKLSADLITDGTTNKVINVKPDWNAASGSDAEILNKPTIPAAVSSFTNDAGYLTENSTVTIDMTDTNGHEYVDLGLPSGTLWATMNVGASSETDYGNYYQYGKGAAQYAATSGDSDYSGTEDPLDSSVDTASQVWGGSWHMPTREQMQELTANTTYQWVTNYKGSGINGGTFTATNGAVLFFPAAGYWGNGSQYYVGNYGYCWGSSPNGSSDACLLSFRNGDKGVNNGSRKFGYSVRGVIEPGIRITKTVKQILTDAATAAIAAEQ